MIRAARGYSERDMQPDLPGESRVSAKPPTNGHIDQETAHMSSLNHHRRWRCDRDRVCVPGARIREASTAFPSGSFGMLEKIDKQSMKIPRVWICARPGERNHDRACRDEFKKADWLAVASARCWGCFLFLKLSDLSTICRKTARWR